MQILGFATFLLAPAYAAAYFLLLQSAQSLAYLYYRSGASWADRVTMLRGWMAAIAAALAVTYAELSWLLWTVLLLALVFDGLDGYLARKQQTCSEHGALFDMETDSIWVSLLTLTCIAVGKAPLWALILPAWRPFYCLLSLALPRIKVHPKGSWFGKTVFVTVGVVLLVVASPLGHYFFPLIILAVASLLLSYSFLKTIVQHLQALQDAQKP